MIGICVVYGVLRHNVDITALSVYETALHCTATAQGNDSYERCTGKLKPYCTKGLYWQCTGSPNTHDRVRGTLHVGALCEIRTSVENGEKYILNDLTIF